MTISDSSNSRQRLAISMFDELSYLVEYRYLLEIALEYLPSEPSPENTKLELMLRLYLSSTEPHHDNLKHLMQRFNNL